MTLPCIVVIACEHNHCAENGGTPATSRQAVVVATYEREWEYAYLDNTNWSAHPTWLADFGVAYDDLRPTVPEGLRVQIYRDDGSNSIQNIAPEGGTVSVSDDARTILFYNNDTEYVVFNDFEQSATAQATTRTRSRATYLGNSYASTETERTVNPPDMLYGYFLDGYMPNTSAEREEIAAAMRPLVFSYLIRYEFSGGLGYVALARGALAGMAEAVYMADGHTSRDAATVLFDCEIKPFGVQATVRSFGVPDFPSDNGTDNARRYALNLEVRLTNSSIKTFEFDVTDQVRRQPQGGVITVKDITVTDEEGRGDGSGFDIKVDGWGEFADIELPL